MPRYSKDQIITIACALKNCNFRGAANLIFWWNTNRHKGFDSTETYKVMKRPLKDMPLFINHESQIVRIIATTRLSYTKGGLKMSHKKKLTDKIKKQFSMLANQLSPENLCGDGEYTQAQAKDKFKTLMIEWHKLEDQIGMKITQETLDLWEEETLPKNMDSASLLQELIDTMCQWSGESIAEKAEEILGHKVNYLGDDLFQIIET